MAVEKVGAVTGLEKSDYQGLSTDTKPTGCAADSSFYELDTKKLYTYSTANTNPATGNGWWEM